MGVQHSDELEAILKKARPRLASSHPLEFKNCFGAVAAYANGIYLFRAGTLV